MVGEFILEPAPDEPERSRRNERHDPGVCGQCKMLERTDFLPTPAQVDAAVITSFRRWLIKLRLRDRERYIVFMGYFTKPRWTDHTAWYLYECPGCEQLTMTYFMGRARLWCKGCGHRWRFSRRPGEARHGMSVR